MKLHLSSWLCIMTSSLSNSIPFSLSYHTHMMIKMMIKMMEWDEDDGVRCRRWSEMRKGKEKRGEVACWKRLLAPMKIKRRNIHRRHLFVNLLLCSVRRVGKMAFTWTSNCPMHLPKRSIPFPTEQTNKIIKPGGQTLLYPVLGDDFSSWSAFLIEVTK